MTQKAWRVARHWQITTRPFSDPHWTAIFEQVALTGTVCMTRATSCLVQRLEFDIVSLWSFHPTSSARTWTASVHSGTRPRAQFFIGEPEKTTSTLITLTQQHLNQTAGGWLPFEFNEAEETPLSSKHDMFLTSLHLRHALTLPVFHEINYPVGGLQNTISKDKVSW